jgi:chromosomal replication initiator protein
MQFLSEVWNSVLAEMREDYSETLMELWFNELHLSYLSDDVAVISTKQKFKRDFLESKYTSVIHDYLTRVGFDVRIIFIATDEKSEAEHLRELGLAGDSAEGEKGAGGAEAAEPELDTPSDPAESDRRNKAFLEKGFDSGINYLSGESKKESVGSTVGSDYTFDNFIVGSSNKFAHAACLAVANRYASGADSDEEYFQKQYNPLFIYGPSGLGKTHLLYAIMNRISELCPEAKIVYVKGDDFTNQLIDSISHGTCEQFRSKYRTADVLLIDDTQFISGKVSTQEEFFHTFNTLYENHKQIVLTCDCPPRSIKTLENRLQTRFEWGLTADIQPPAYELRIAIMKSKAEALGISLPADVLEFLANNLRSNVRQLEGAVKKLGAQSFLTGAQITVDLAISCVADLMTGSEPASVTVDRILEKVSQKYGVSVEDIKGRKRTKEIALVRHRSIYIIRKLTDLSFPAIGKLFGRDHTTIMASLDTVEREMAKDSLLEIEMSDLIRELRG